MKRPSIQVMPGDVYLARRTGYGVLELARCRTSVLAWINDPSDLRTLGEVLLDHRLIHGDPMAEPPRGILQVPIDHPSLRCEPPELPPKEEA